MNNAEKLCGALIGNVITTAGWLQDMENIVSIVCCIAGFIITLIIEKDIRSEEVLQYYPR